MRLSRAGGPFSFALEEPAPDRSQIRSLGNLIYLIYTYGVLH